MAPSTFIQWAWLIVTVAWLIAWGTGPVRSFEPVTLTKAPEQAR